METRAGLDREREFRAAARIGPACGTSTTARRGSAGGAKGKKAFTYIDADGRAIRDKASSRRIRSLAIPPAWQDVWICPAANGHLQATGRDARGRKQYRYHPRWREVRDETKYDRMIAFAQGAAADPRTRRTRSAAARPAAREGARHRRAAAGDDADPRRQRRVRPRTTIVRPDDAARPARQDSTARRCASSSAARAASSTRSTSTTRGWRDRQAHAATCRARSCSSTSTTTASVHDVDSADVNDYLREISGEEFTAKDFRTWAGTVLAAQALQEFAGVRLDEPQAKRNIVQAIESVAERLGNTQADLPQVLRPPGGDRRLHGRLPRQDAETANGKGAARHLHRPVLRGGGGAGVAPAAHGTGTEWRSKTPTKKRTKSKRVRAPRTKAQRTTSKRKPRT